MDLFDEQAGERHRTPVARVDLAAHHAFGVSPTTFTEFARTHAREFVHGNG
ncbi:MAG TPA: hypothetical protein VGN37_04640 [Actinocatenispora sp.]